VPTYHSASASLVYLVDTHTQARKHLDLCDAPMPNTNYSAGLLYDVAGTNIINVISSAAYRIASLQPMEANLMSVLDPVMGGKGAGGGGVKGPDTDLLQGGHLHLDNNKSKVRLITDTDSLYGITPLTGMPRGKIDGRRCVCVRKCVYVCVRVCVYVFHCNATATHFRKHRSSHILHILTCCSRHGVYSYLRSYLWVLCT